MITYCALGRNGRLGNQLWQIASTIGLAHRRNESAGFPFWRYCPYFSVPPFFFPDLAATEPTTDLGLDFLQDLSLLRGVEHLIKAYFQPAEDVRDTIRSRHTDILSLPKRTAVHVRRGDYLKYRDHFRQLPLGYLEDAMELLGPPFVVFSDDIAWCRQHLPSECYFVQHNRDFEDLFLMTMCESHVTSNSTFSWWGAWLSGGTAVYPASWYGPELADRDPTTVFPEGSTVL